MPKSTILVTAYAVNPFKGSEDGMGWNMIFEIAKHQKVIAITRENNQPAIDKYIEENPFDHCENIQFEYFDLPYYLRFWKKGGRGALLYFYLWQMAMVFCVKKRKLIFDIAHNLNFHNDWTPTFLWMLGKPMVWGPVGHHPQIPKDYLIHGAGKKAWQKDMIRTYGKSMVRNFDPFLWLAKKKAKTIFCMHTDVPKKGNINIDKVVWLASVGTHPVKFNKIKNDQFNILSVGRFVPLKGFDMTIRAFADFYNKLSAPDQSKAKLTLIGKGPERKKLIKLAQTLQVDKAIEFIEWMDRKDLDAYFAKTDLFFFPSHEGAGMVVPEAMSFAVPILCYDNVGPGEMVNDDCGRKVPYTNYKQSVLDFSNYLQELYQNRNLIDKLSTGALERYKDTYTWEQKGMIFTKVYKELLQKKVTEITLEKKQVADA